MNNTGSLMLAQTFRFSVCVVLFGACVPASTATRVSAAEAEDEFGGDLVLRWNPFYDDAQRPVEITLNERRVADGEAGLREVIERVRRMPEGASLLYGPNPSYFLSGPPGAKATVPSRFANLWDELQHAVRERDIKTSWLGYLDLHWVKDPHRFDFEIAERKKPDTTTLDIQWRHFPFDYAPRDHVVYLVDGKYVGLGDRGFDEVLQRVAGRPAGTTIIYSQYGLHAKASDEGGFRERLEKDELLPFATRKSELEQLIVDRGLQVRRPRQLYWPNPPYSGRIDEEQPLSYYHSLLRVATIVRDGREPTPAKIVVSWKQAAALDRPGAEEQGGVNDDAEYFVNDAPTGRGVAGFLEAVRRIEECRPGDVVRINPVYIRTQAPFSCALFAPGHRHFETTGVEPFQGVVDVLVDVVERRKLRVELIPDEGKPNRWANSNK